eukprot:4836540-Pyramimonas_sp.AAC.1
MAGKRGCRSRSARGSPFDDCTDSVVGGTPSSRACLAALQQRWCAWAGRPKRMALDRGLRNRGVFL